MSAGGGATARLFLAVDPPEQVRLELAGWARAVASQGRARARGRPELRALGAEVLHVTLCFLGSRPVGEIDDLARVPAATAGEVGELSVGAPLWLPPRRPRNLTVEIHDHDGELERLQQELVGELRRAIDWEPERRRFRAHLTVARVRGREPVSATSGATFELPPTPALRFRPESLTLYRSWLQPSGASYEA
ncbi:MAG TPA: RNA 2',3'-cyclic phosphodiesterase, partial [Solirubrobacteraceae bacterium]|nr:RNA 2',3'-cyclic phosphodiesterase [Solirubrobacteraceae bacterium]